MQYDLLVRGGHLIDPAQGLDGRYDVGLAGGRVVAVGPDLDAAAAQQVVDAGGRLVTPGLVDLHVHAFWGVSHYGIEVDPACLARGVTTAVDAGSAGAQTFPGFRRYVIDVVSTRLFAFLNIAASGMISDRVGELEDIRWATPDEAVAVAQSHRDVIVGIKVRLSRNIAGENCLPALRLARAAADRLGLPVMVHPGGTVAALPEILALLGKGDVLTHTYHGREHGILDERRQVLPAVRAAVGRGLILDVGHGRGSFSFDVARRGLEQGVLPATISSDLHAHNIDGPVYDLATTLSKFLHLGLPLDEVLKRATAAPAQVLGLDKEIGTLQVGAAGDVAIFAPEQGEFPLTDCEGETLMARQRLVPWLVIRAGQVYTGAHAGSHVV